MTDSVVVGLGIGFVVLSGIMGMLSAVVRMEMESQVNSTRPPEQQVWWGWGLTPRNPHPLTAEYRRLYPDGPLLRRAVTLTGLALGLFAVGVLLIFPIWLGVPVVLGLLAVFGLFAFVAYRR